MGSCKQPRSLVMLSQHTSPGREFRLRTMYNGLELHQFGLSFACRNASHTNTRLVHQFSLQLDNEACVWDIRVVPHLILVHCSSIRKVSAKRHVLKTHVSVL
jgi:hypothetical protein